MSETRGRTLAQHQRRPLAQRIPEIAAHYWDLGFTSFGGPGVHVIILRKRFVDDLKWVDERTFLDLFSLGNALPGPGSTQLAFSIAVVKCGVLPGLVAFLFWSIPGALGMAALGAGVSRIPDTLPPAVLALLTGLNAAAVGLIALAAYQLGMAAGTDRLTVALVWLSAGFGICYHAPWMYPTLIAAGGLATVSWDFRRAWLFVPLKKAIRQSHQPPQAETEFQGQTSDRADVIELHRIPPLEQPSSSQLEASGYNDDKIVIARGRPGPSTQVAYPSPAASPVPSRRRLPQETDIEPITTSSPVLTETDAPLAPPETGQVAANALNVVSIRTALVLLGAFVMLLTIPLATRAGLKNAGKDVPRGLDLFANMIIAGTIIFGGGPVVIPLLRDYVVVEGWVNSRDFLLVFAILQAFPGPNFNFSVALGILACPAYRPLGAILAYLGIFSPGIILKLGLLPFYASWRDKALARSLIRGLNASATGLVFTAVWQLFLVGYIYQSANGLQEGQTVSGPLTSDPFWAVVSSGAFLGCRSFSAPPWLSIALGGVAGLAWYGVRAS